MNERYVERTVLPVEDYYKYGADLFHLFSAKKESLYSLVKAGKKRIVLLGDAGDGKSFELGAIASKLIDEKNSQFVPIPVSLDQYVDEDIEAYVRIHLQESAYLLDQAPAALVFLFDEFDQVQSKGVVVKKIGQFMHKYEAATVVISCRTNVYSGQFEDYEQYKLVPLDDDEIREFVKKRLKEKAEDFLNKVEKAGFWKIMRTPFFVDGLMKIYRKDEKIPTKLEEILARVISVSIDADLQSTPELRDRYSRDQIERVLTKLSVVMECLPRNHVSLGEFVEIVGAENRILAEKLSILRKAFSNDGDVIQFGASQRNLSA